MSRLLTALLLFATVLGTAEVGFGQVRVKGYTRNDGTYVRPHYRSNPDGNFWNNWSTKGNVNPYTGKPGTHVTPPSNYGRRTSYSSWASDGGSLSIDDFSGSFADLDCEPLTDEERLWKEMERRREETREKRKIRLARLVEAVARQKEEHTVRNWTDNTGVYHVNARFGGLTRTTVTLHCEDGRLVKVDRSRLSELDNRYIDDLWRRRFTTLTSTPAADLALR